MRPTVPCKDCKDRELRCHSNCTEYLEYAREMQNQRDMRQSRVDHIDFYISEKRRIQ